MTALAGRFERAREVLASSGADAVLLGLGADLRYLTGYRAHALERLTMLVLQAEGPAVLVAPRLEAMAAAQSDAAVAGLVEIQAWDETEDPYALVASRLRALGAEAAAGRVLVDSSLPARHLLALQRRLEGHAFGLATEVMRDLRMVKAADEIALLRRAAHAADRVVARIAGGSLVGRTEAEVSAEVRDLLLAEGHDEATFAIVASGPNGASPHHGAGERRLAAGDPVVLDIGGTIDGYGSDITRMLWIAGAEDGSAGIAPTSEFLDLFELVRRAQESATAAVRPGARAGDLDEVARSVIRDGGYGDAFIHRLGHGIGLEGHEEPYLVAGSDEALAVGHAFSIEPGIYLAGRFGVRIEDIVVCGPDGPDVLNEAPRDLLVVRG
ncbi:MAG TPA: Xaa-Pro peptidase family protein [Candidatus Limnocylindrales bacterium]|nr:Xaa-Pro peptidase family protein [Candidatus Limnocylindrales bacterium]